MIIEPPFDVVMYNDFLNLSDIIALSHTNKYYRIFCKEIIKRYIQKLNKITIIIHRNRLFYKNYYSIESRENFYKTYPNDYWYCLFGKQLNSEMLAVYYANFINKLDFIGDLLFGKNSKVYSLWKFIAYPDGYIKTISKKDLENYSSYNSEIIVSIKIHISYIEHVGFHSNYITAKHEYIEIDYCYNFKTHDRIYIDEKILQAYLSNKTYRGIYSSDKYCKSNECGKWCGNNNECNEIFNNVMQRIT